jgi:tetratricopeptide (TPR) repeat protein
MIKRVSALILILLIIFLSKNLVYQFKNYSLAKEYQSKGDMYQAIDYYERVILAYTPLSPVINNSVDNLLNICYKANDQELKLYCLETLRSSLIQTKSFYQPYYELLEKLNIDTAELRTEIITKNYQITNKKEIYNQQLNIIKFNRFPDTFWSFLSILALIGWISMVFYTILKPEKTLIRWIVISIFYILWAYGLYKA